LGLEKSWTWSGSPLASVTAAAAVLTGVLAAADPLREILGEAGDNEVAVLLVASALTVALTGAAPLLLYTFRKEPGEIGDGSGAKDEPVDTHAGSHGNFTILGLLVACTAVVAANLGLIGTVVVTLWDSSAINRAVLVVGAIAAAALVVAYTVRAMRHTLKEGIHGTSKAPALI
jgi:hypothetical protein